MLFFSNCAVGATLYAGVSMSHLLRHCLHCMFGGGSCFFAPFAAPLGVLSPFFRLFRAHRFGLQPLGRDVVFVHSLYIFFLEYSKQSYYEKVRDWYYCIVRVVTFDL